VTSTVLVTANVTDADTGYVGERLAALGFTLRTALRERGEVPPTVPERTAVVLLLGSAWSVHTPVRPEVLAAETALVRSAHAAGVPLLGLCYGAQVIAHALGGRVSRAPEPEVGLVVVDTEDPEVLPRGPWLAFHTDVLYPPEQARVVGRNGCGVQAFTLPGVMAVQFHPEVRPATLDDGLGRFPEFTASLAAQLAALVEQARSGNAAFDSAATEAERLAASAGAAQSESWIAAQEALTAAIAARKATATGLGDIDGLAAAALQANAGIAPNDLAAIKSARAEVAALDARQAARIDRVQKTLGL